jgi:hypothetical protein
MTKETYLWKTDMIENGLSIQQLETIGNFKNIELAKVPHHQI